MVSSLILYLYWVALSRSIWLIILTHSLVYSSFVGILPFLKIFLTASLGCFFSAIRKLLYIVCLSYAKEGAIFRFAFMHKESPTISDKTAKVGDSILRNCMKKTQTCRFDSASLSLFYWKTPCLFMSEIISNTFLSYISRNARLVLIPANPLPRTPALWKSQSGGYTEHY